MGEFRLTIKMGNDAMRHPEDVADALRHVATMVEETYTSGRVVDLNGNTTGRWSVDYPEPEEAASDD